MKLDRVFLSLSLLAITLLSACGEKKEFGAAVTNQTKSADITGQEGSQSLPPQIQTPGSSSSAPIPDECKMGNATFTQVSLLSKSMSSKPMVQSLKYELSMVSCRDGKVVPIINESLFFDLNGRISTQGFPTINYIVSDSKSGSLITQGTLEVVQGSDLFGNSGQFAHWKTNSLSHSGTLEKVILEIKLDNIGLTPAQAENAPTMDSYLRVGQAIPVTQAIMVTY